MSALLNSKSMNNIKPIPAPWTFEAGVYVADRSDFPSGKASCPSCKAGADQWSKTENSGPTETNFVCQSCKAEIKITNDKSLETAQSKTATATHDKAVMSRGFGIAYSNSKGQDATEKEINRLEHSVNVLSNEGMSMLIYDIPDHKNKDCPNPSWILWRFGFRLNDSCWVLPDKSLKSTTVRNLIAHWEAHKATGFLPGTDVPNGVESHIVPYAEHAMAQIRSIARGKLRMEIMRQHESLIKRLQSAAERHQEAVAALDASEQPVEILDRVKAESKKDNETRSILKRAGEHLDAAIHCAQAFDETESIADLLTGLRQVLQSETKLFNVDMRKKGSKPAPEVKA